MGTDVITGSTTLSAPVGVVFDYVFDYGNIPQWVAGVSGCYRNEDAPYDFTLEISVHSITHRAAFTTRSWVLNDSISLVSTDHHEAGVDMEFMRIGPNSCAVAVTLRYPVANGLIFRPVNLAGRAVAQRILDRSARKLEASIARRSS
ncbi:SRPBCC family protein [Nocardia terpenica]|uniref:Coenzyme Q-binding protein COQ10 START domain-containing protein n=1 Tax=Nocardia terpenica TaxID=455432 RepID=A0A6G9ZEG9_9NOCA|nr:SRPBCC family protein [Nocardia terpenica]QIS23393.1 hypothetical protein F6W96_38730 [Nocardia terpenica]